MRPKIPNRFPLLMILAFAVALLNSLIGCSPLSPLYPKVIAADAQILSKCKYLGEITGSAGDYIPSLTRSEVATNEIAMQNAKGRALQEAAGLGATHVVWARQTYGNDAQIWARAYKCK